MLDASEVMALIIVLYGYFSVMTCFRDRPHTKFFFLAYTALIMGMLATNLEEYVAPSTLNLIEHGVGVAGAGILFLYWAYQHYRQEHALTKKLQEMDR